MNATDGLVWFVGDLDDPWVAAVADALPPGTRRLACAGDLPDDWPVSGCAAAEAGTTGGTMPRVVVLHRAWLSPHDAERLARLRSNAGAMAGTRPGVMPRVVLCVSPHVRHAELERWLARGLIDAIVPEATARDTIARHVASGAGGGLGGPGETVRPRLKARARVAVVSTNFELRRTLMDACTLLGYCPVAASDWREAPEAGLALWDVPVLEPDWPRTLARRARLGAVAALLGFASRTLVAEARAQGAAACLELPYELLDVGHVLGRLSARRSEPAHQVPPRPASQRRRGAVGPTGASHPNPSPNANLNPNANANPATNWPPVAGPAPGP